MRCQDQVTGLKIYFNSDENHSKINDENTREVHKKQAIGNRIHN